MRKFFSKSISLSLVALLILAGSGCTPATPGSGSTATVDPSSPATEAVQSLPATAPRDESVLVMGTEASFRPYEYYEGTEVVGVDVDIAKEIAKELGKELVVENMEFSSIIPAVNSGKVDFGAAGMSVTPERAEQVAFTIEYTQSKQVILTKTDSGIVEEKDLIGKNIGVQLGTVADLYLSEEYPDMKIMRYNKYFESVGDLSAGRIDAIVVDSMPAQELQKTAAGLIICEKELFTDVYAFCVKKENTELLTAINKVMQRLMDEGKIAEFTTKHLA